MAAARVIVTGGSQGIGRAIALTFAKQGARVAIAARDARRLAEVVAEIDGLGGVGSSAQMDVSDPRAVVAALRQGISHCGGIVDVLVNNAGVFDIHAIEEETLEGWRRMLDVNLTGPFLVTRETLAALKLSPRAHIFNIASVAAQRGFSGCTSYCASKYGLRGFSDALRVDLAPFKIRVSTVYPDTTDTAIFDRVPGDWDRSKMNQPEDVAAVVVAAYGAPLRADVDDLEVPRPG